MSSLSWAILCALIGMFVAMVSWVLVLRTHKLFRGRRSSLVFLAGSGVVLISLGTILMLLAVNGEVSGVLKTFLMLAGASAIGIPVSIILHNIVYGLFISWFGADFWNRITSEGDEPFFFMIGLIVCPVAFLVGTVGSIVLAIR